MKNDIKQTRLMTELITIGDEILIGQIVDTNSAWIGAELSNLGFQLHQISSVSDKEKAISDSFSDAWQRSDLVIVTGGLGPTKDDITKQVLCRFFDTELVFDEEVYQNIENLFKNRPNVMNELTRSQAMVPKNCVVMQNRVGTAPIMLFEREGKTLVSLPGVPFEMQEAMREQVIPYLMSKYRPSHLLQKTIQVYGYPESQLAIKLNDWEDALPENLSLAYLPNYSLVRLRLSGVGDDLLSLDLSLSQQLDSLRALLGSAIVSELDVPVEEFVGERLAKQGKTLSVAESCTGGNISHLITTVPGSSLYFKGSVVAYSNKIKTSLLNVDTSVIEEEGAVSQIVAERMAQGAMKLFESDFAVASTGIAGPGGGTPQKPVGLVWITACSKEKMLSRKFFFHNQRKQNIERATQAALLLLTELL